jgi:hypothetical protein
MRARSSTVERSPCTREASGSKEIPASPLDVSPSFILFACLRKKFHKKHFTKAQALDYGNMFHVLSPDESIVQKFKKIIFIYSMKKLLTSYFVGGGRKLQQQECWIHVL